jgi:hypothetical protein
MLPLVDGKGEIRGKGKLISNKLPRLDDVFFVEGLFSNLISVSQLCDQGLEVSFNKFGCRVTNKEGLVLMRGSRTKNNCYKWIPEDQTDMLNRMLKHQKGQNSSHLQGMLRNSQGDISSEINQVKI